MANQKKEMITIYLQVWVDTVNRLSLLEREHEAVGRMKANDMTTGEWWDARYDAFKAHAEVEEKGEI